MQIWEDATTTKTRERSVLGKVDFLIPAGTKRPKTLGCCTVLRLLMGWHKSLLLLLRTKH